MFSYVDQAIRRRLERDSNLVYLGRDGTPVPEDAPQTPSISLLGPIPIPRRMGDKEVVFSWYPF